MTDISDLQIVKVAVADFIAVVTIETRRSTAPRSSRQRKLRLILGHQILD